VAIGQNIKFSILLQRYTFDFAKKHFRFSIDVDGSSRKSYQQIHRIISSQMLIKFLQNFFTKHVSFLYSKFNLSL